MLSPPDDDYDLPIDETPRAAAKRHSALCDKIRRIWIDEWNRHYARTHPGKQSNYTPGTVLDGGHRKVDGTFTAPIWPKVLAFVLSNKVNLIMFIRAQFRGAAPPPNPNVFLNDRGLKIYADFVDSPSVREDAQVLLQAQWSAAKNALHTNTTLYGDVHTAYKVILLDLNLPLSALFRYCLAIKCGFEAIANIYKEEAYIQYVYDKVIYDEVWKDIIPEELNEA